MSHIPLPIPVSIGGTGSTSTGSSREALSVDLTNNTSDANKPVSTATQTALDAKKADSMGTGKILGRSTGGTGAIEELTLGANMTLIAGVLNALAGGVSDGDKGDITVSVAGTVWTIDAGAVTLAKQADVATGTVFYRKTAGTGVPEVQTLATLKTDLVLVKGDVGLGNVDNTSDAGKPVSTAQQTALDLKAPLASPTFTGTVAGITKTMVGLGSVDNTADSAKPVSTSQQTALDLKANLASPTFTGTVTLPAQTVTLAMQANMATASVLYRKTAGTGVPEVQTLATLKTDLGLSGTNSGDQTISDATITTTDITTNDATTAKHGFLQKLPGGTTTFLRADGAFAAPAAAVAITEAEVDVGSTPVQEAIVAVADAGITTNSKIIGGVAYKAATGKDLDECEMDALEMKFEPLAGSMNVHIKGLEGYLSGAFRIWYTYSA